MAITDVTQKSRIYHTFAELTTAFAAIVGHCDTLQRTGLFKINSSKTVFQFHAGAASGAQPGIS
jgi:hypothetical protein